MKQYTCALMNNNMCTSNNTLCCATDLFLWLDTVHFHLSRLNECLLVIHQSHHLDLLLGNAIGRSPNPTPLFLRVLLWLLLLYILYFLWNWGLSPSMNGSGGLFRRRGRCFLTVFGNGFNLRRGSRWLLE